MSISISIVVAAHNVQGCIGDCLDAILAQIEPSHELVVIDDGSSDATLVRIEAARKANAGVRFTLQTQAHQGAAAARNAGVAAARGEYIAFVDGEDVLLPGALAALSETIARYQSDVVVCDFNLWRPDRGPTAKGSRTRVRNGYPAARLQDDRRAILSILFADRHMYLCAHVFRRAVYALLPAPAFPPGHGFEELATLPRLLSQCASLVYLPQPIVDRRQLPGTGTGELTDGWAKDFTLALMQTRGYLEQLGVDASVQRQFDVAASHLYINVVKKTYLLNAAGGERLRARIKAAFRHVLYQSCTELLAAVRAGQTVTHNRKNDLATIRQVDAALRGSMVFGLRQAAGRKIRLLQRTRKTVKAN